MIEIASHIKGTSLPLFCCFIFDVQAGWLILALLDSAVAVGKADPPTRNLPTRVSQMRHTGFESVICEDMS